MKRTPLRRKTWMRRRRPTPRRSERVLDPAFLDWVHRQPCIVRELPPDPSRITRCGGRLEADHLGDRPHGRRADDITCAPMCHDHHDERTNQHGSFRNLVKAELRDWRGRVLELVAARWASAKVVA